MVTISARQIQLSHALGLGPMWVSRAAQIVSCDTVPNLAEATPALPRNTAASAPVAHIAAAPVAPNTHNTLKPSAPSAARNDSVTASDAASVQHKVSKRAAALLAHIAQAQQHKPKQDSAQAVAAEHTVVAADCSQDSLLSLQTKITQCTACDLHGERRQAFAAQVRPNCRLIVVLPHPSVQDDAAGELLSGEAGELWLKILKAMKLQADEVYVTNAIKCAPNVSLVPKQHHAAACIGYLQRELQLLPAVPVLLLAENQRSLLKKLEQQVGSERLFRIPHPSKMQRNPDTKREAWEILQTLMPLLPTATQ